MDNLETSFFPDQDVEEGRTTEEIQKEKRAYDESLRGEEEIAEGVVAEGKKRMAAVVEIDKLFDKLDKALAPRDMEIVGDIREALEKNRKILEREDGSGKEEVRDYYQRLDSFLNQKKRMAA